MKKCLLLLTSCVLSTSISYAMQQRPTLWAAAAGGNREVVKHYITEKADLNVPGQFGMTPLMVATLSKHTLIVQDLINAHAKLDCTTTGDGKTALLLATGESPIATMLLEAEGGIELRNYPGKTLLALIAKHRSASIMQRFFDTPFVDVYAVSRLIPSLYALDKCLIFKKNRETAAAYPGSHKYQLLAMLEQPELDTYLNDPVGYTKNIVCSTKYKQTPLMWSALFGHIDAAQVALKDNNLTDDYVTARDLYNRTALMYAALTDNMPIIRLLMCHPAVRTTINTRSCGGYTALDYAALYGYAQIALILIENGARITAHTISRAAQYPNQLLGAYLLVAKLYPGVKLIPQEEL